MPQFPPFGALRRTPPRPLPPDRAQALDARLARLNADPLKREFNDRDYRDFVVRAFDTAYPPEAETPEPVDDALPAFRPAPRPRDVLPEAAVGPRQANRPADVIGAKRLLSALGAYRFDPGEEPSTDAGPKLVDAVKRFQTARGLEPDGVLQPGGPTLRTMAAAAFPGEGLEDRVARSAAFNPRLEEKRRKEAEAELAASKGPLKGPVDERDRTASEAGARGDSEPPTKIPNREPSMGGEGLMMPPVVDTPRIVDPPGQTPVDVEEWYEILTFDPEGIGEEARAVRDPIGVGALRVARDRAIDATQRLLPELQPPHNNAADAFRHALLSYLVTKALGPAAAKRWLDSHEVSYPNDTGERIMDLFNNAVGRELALDLKNQNRTPEEVILEALERSLLQVEPVIIEQDDE